MDLGLRGKTVLVTGSSRGIGRAVARAFAAEGAKVAVTSRTRVDAAGALVFTGDFTREAVIVRCLKKLKTLDVLVANIGTGRGKPGLAADDREWARLLDANLLGAARLIRAAAPYLTKDSSVVFVSSIAGLERLGAPLPYEAAKAALLALSKGLSRELAPRGIRVNAVAPGNILFAGGAWEERLKSGRAKIEAMLRAEVPLGRFGRPEEVADAVVFLCSARASFITGSCLVVDGGQTRSHA